MAVVWGSIRSSRGTEMGQSRGVVLPMFETSTVALKRFSGVSRSSGGVASHRRFSSGDTLGRRLGPMKLA